MTVLRCVRGHCSFNTPRSPGAAPLPLPAVPKMESHLECRLWNEIFVDAQKDLVGGALH